jgi:hypothetical protein
MNDQVKAEVGEAFQHLEVPVRPVHLAQKHACGACAEQQDLLEEVPALSDRRRAGRE